MSKMIEFYHGALADSYEEQANKQGLTLGKYAEFAQNVGFGLVAAHIHGCITDSEYDKILQRFQKKILIKNLKPMEGRLSNSNE
jgi:pyridoxine 5'-phosphate synthase PdxJ